MPTSRPRRSSERPHGMVRGRSVELEKRQTWHKGVLQKPNAEYGVVQICEQLTSGWRLTPLVLVIASRTLQKKV